MSTTPSRFARMYDANLTKDMAQVASDEISRGIEKGFCCMCYHLDSVYSSACKLCITTRTTKGFTPITAPVVRIN